MMTDLRPDQLGADARRPGGPRLLLPHVLMLPDGPAYDHAVLIRDGVFAQVGPAAELLRDNPGLAPVHLDRKLLMPGFVDAHHHLTQAFGKALVFGEPSEIFRRVWVPLERTLDEHTAYVSAKLAALEALRGGFTTVADAGTRAHVDVGVVADAARDAGIRCVLGLICNDVGDELSTPQTVEQRASDHLSRFVGDPLIHPSLAVSIPEAATERTLQRVSRLCAEAGAVLQTHVNEFLGGVEGCVETHGHRPLAHLRQLGVLGPHLLGAHATLLTPMEIRLLADTGTAISYNPVASGWKGNAVAPALEMAAQDVRFGLGTDGTRGDGFRLLDASELAQRLTRGVQVGDFSCGGGWTWFDRATLGGADAVGLGRLTGQITPGRAADFLVLDLDVPELTPSWDLTWEIVRLAGARQVIAVVVGGRVRLWRGWPTDWDGHALLDEVAKLAQRTVEAAGITRVHANSAEHRRLCGGPT